MSPQAVAIIGLIIFIVLLFARMEIALAMATTGFVGLMYLRGTDVGLEVLGRLPTGTVASYATSAVPLFILMGAVVANTGVAADLYNAAYKWIGQLRGGLAMATIVACGAFATITSSSNATVATIGKVALPEMKKHNYDIGMASGSVAAGGTLGVLIPPSIVFIVYGVLTQQSIGKLFMAGIIPGILVMVFYIATISILCQVNPRSGPAGPKTNIKEKFVSLRSTWPVVLLFLLVLGGIYAGIFTATEAGAVGAFGAIIITFFSRRLTSKNFINSILETGQTTAMIMFIMVGAYIFQNFISISQLPFTLGEFVTQISVSRYLIIALIIFIYLILGMFLPPLAAVVLTLPIIFPSIVAMGFDPIWYGVLMVRVAEVASLTPPVAMNVFVLAAVSGVPTSTIFRGVTPFILADLLNIALLVAVPWFSLFIPSMM